MYTKFMYIIYSFVKIFLTLKFINMKRIFLLPVCAGIIAFMASCGGSRSSQNTDGLQGEISISGAFALYPLAVRWVDEFREMHPGVKVDISAGGAGKGMTDALAKVVDFGMVSREVYPVEIERGAVVFAVAKDAVLPVINVENPDLENILKKGISAETAHKIWIDSENLTWGALSGSGNTAPVRVYTRSDACGAAETWALYFGERQEDLSGTAVFGDPGLAMAVQKDKLGIGYNNISYVYDEATRKPNEGLIVLPIDINNNGQIDSEELFYDNKDAFIQAVADDIFPSPPARDLYLVTNGIPDKPEVIAFLKYVLTKGQQHNLPAGYIALSEEKLAHELSILNK